MKTSNFLSLDFKDFVQGLVMAILTPAALIVQQAIESGVLMFNWKSIAMASIAGGFAYLVKKFFTQPKEVNYIIGGSTPPPDKDEK